MNRSAQPVAAAGAMPPPGWERDLVDDPLRPTPAMASPPEAPPETVLTPAPLAPELEPAPAPAPVGTATAPPATAQPATAQPVPDSPGARLRLAREARRLDLNRVAAELRLRPAVIDALERDDYGDLPGAVFVGGYLRGYARLVGLDPEPLLAAFRRLHPAAEAPPPRVTAPAEESEGGGLLVPAVSFLVVLALLGGVYLWWQQHERAPVGVPRALPAPGAGPSLPRVGDAAAPGAARPTPQTGAPATDPADEVGGDPDQARSSGAPGASLTEPPSRSAPGPTTAGDVAPSSVAGPSAAAASAAATGPPSDAAVSAVGGTGPAASAAAADGPAPPVPAPATEAADASATPTAASEVVLSFSGASWINIRDASGEFQLYGEMKNGDRHVLAGEPPWSMTIGNAQATAVTIGGVPFDLNAVARGNVVRLPRFDPAASPTAAPAPKPASQPARPPAAAD